MPTPSPITPQDVSMLPRYLRGLDSAGTRELSKGLRVAAQTVAAPAPATVRTPPPAKPLTALELIR